MHAQKIASEGMLSMSQSQVQDLRAACQVCNGIPSCMPWP